MNKKILKTIFILLFLFIIVFAGNGNTVYAANITVGDITYNENDFTKLRTFLNQYSDVTGVTNGEALNSWYDENNPVTWTGVTWTDSQVRRIKTISWDTKSLAGNLDLSGATSMTSLVCSNNKLTSLNVSGNTAMTILSCFSNQLTELDLSTNKKLIAVNCSFNKLSDIDVSLNTALTNLCCYSNDITKLDVSKNTALTYLDSNTNKLTELDVSNNKKLSTLLCYSNQLAELDLINNTLLTSLDCHSNKLSQLNVDVCTKLTLLNCNSNQLTELDLSKNTKVTNFTCSDNKLVKIMLKISNKNINIIARGNGYVEFFLDSSKAFTTAVPFQQGTSISWEDVDKGEQLSNSYTYNLTGGLPYNLQASFVQNVTFNSQGGSEVAAISVKYNSTITALTMPIKDGCFFDGWYKEADCINKWDFAVDKVTTETTLYAKWQQITKDITINGITYNSNDYIKVKAFLNQSKLDYIDEYMYINEYEDEYIYFDDYRKEIEIYRDKYEDECINGKRINKAYDENNPATWIGITWTDGSVKRIKTISWFNKSLYGKLDLSGFTELTSLDCSNNSIIALNLKDDSKLTDIDCIYNHLGEINVSGITGLINLNCLGNLLASLDVSENVELRKLNCAGNNLTDLDISKNTDLYYFRCSNNKLTELDTSNNQLLEDLECHNNKLTKFKAELADDFAFKSINLIANGNGYFDIISAYPIDFMISIKAFPREGSKFANWTDSFNNTVISTNYYYNDFKPRVIYDLQANFSQNVILNPQGGGEISAIVVDYNSTLGETEIPIYEGYVFDGWYKEADCINKWDFSTDRVTSETTLYAKWVSTTDVFIDGITYNGNDYNKLRAFLNQESAVAGIINGQILNTAYDENSPDTWTGVTWTDGKIKHIKTIYWSYKNLNGRLDLSGATELTSLECYGNKIIELLTTDDTNLTYIKCNSNMLSRIDISNNTELIYLDCSYNQLKYLDVNTNKELTKLYCNSNELISLDVSENKKLIDLECNYNELTSLDTSRNPELLYLSCSDNNLTNIDTSKNLKLFSITCSYNKITEVDISNNLLLRGIEIYGCDLKKFKSEIDNDYCYKSLNLIANGNGYLYISNHPVSGEILVEAIPMKGNSFANWTDPVSNYIISERYTLRDWKPNFSYNLHANFSQNVIFNSQGGSEVASKIVNYSNTVAEPQRPIYEGYIFDGWYKEADCINKWDFSTDRVTSETILYAKWVSKEILYTVTFNTNGGIAISNISNIKYGDTIAAPDTPTRDGYDFLGWFKDSNYKNAWDYSKDVVKSDIILYAKWIASGKTYTVKFNVEGSTVSEINNIKYGDTITAPLPPIKDGFKFKGWYKDSALLDDWDLTTDVVKSDIILYAKWVAEEIFYTVTFVDGDNTYSLINNVKAGSIINAPTTPTKENCVFMGWYKEVDDNKAWDFIRDGVTSNIILYARWLSATDVTIDGITYSGNDYNKLRTFLNQESAVAGKTNGQMINTAYDENDPKTWAGVSWCIGYYDNIDVKYINEISWASKSLAGKLDLRGAKYLEKLNCSSNQIVELDLGGAENIEELNCSSNQLSMLDISEANWLFSLDCSYNHINKLDIGSYFDISLNCSSNDMSELYIDYEVYSLKCSGNKFSRINLKYYYLDIISSGNGYIDINYEHSKYVNIFAIPNSGYSFVNWTDTSKGNQVSSAATIYISAYDLDMNSFKYTANFTQKVIFNSQGGSGVEATTVNYSSTIKAPNPPTYEGYTFKGWYKEPDCINPWDFAKDVVKENITLYAKWDAEDFFEEVTKLNDIGENLDLVLIPDNTYKVEFNLEVDSTFLVINNVTSGSAITAPNIPVKEGYTFEAWYRDENCTEPWNFATDVVIADIKLYAKWLPI